MLQQGGQHCVSAGLRAVVGHGADPIAIELMAERGLDLSAHRARQVESGIASESELILVMEKRHRQILESRFPHVRGRVQLLGHFGGFDIPDPYGKPRVAFESSLDLIERGIDDYVRAFWSPK
jgi:protein-tyrosine phosphatase